MIRADDACGLHPTKFGDSDKAQAGDSVLAVSNRPGLPGAVAEGMISAAGRAVTQSGNTVVLREAIQSIVPIDPGSGALVNASGQVIGIPTLAVSLHDGPQSDGIAFAIASNLARDTASQIIDSGRVADTLRAALGTQAPLTIGSAPNCPSPV